MNIWDTQSDKQILSNYIYKNAFCFIICCSYDSYESLSNVKGWLEHIKSNLTESYEKPIIFIICNKFDISSKKFSEKELHKESKQILKFDNFFQTIKLYDKVSAKNNTNLDTIFKKIASLSISNFQTNRTRSISFSLKIEEEKSIKNYTSFSIKNISNENKLKIEKSNSKCCK